MLNKLENFVAGVASGVTKGINEMAEEAKGKRARENISSEDYEMLKDRVDDLEKQMQTAMELIGILQKQVMNTDFGEEEPEEDQEEPA